VPDAISAVFECEVCSRRYPWNEAIAGKAVRCKCGEVMTAPANAPADPLYDLAPAPVAPEPPKLPPIAREANPITYGAPEPSMMAMGDIIYNKPRDLYVPIALIAFGTALQFARAFARGSGTTLGPVSYVGLVVSIDMVVLFIGIVAAAKVLSVNFGPVPTAILKLCAISLGPDSLAWVAYWALGSSYGGLCAGILVSLVAYWVLFSYLFELDAQDTFYTVSIVYTIYMFTFYSILFILPSWMHR
jgi:hypothetical protein